LLEALCAGKSSLEELRRADLSRAIRSRLTKVQLDALARHAPDRLRAPSGNRHALEYPEEGSPVLAVRIQEVFGLRESPRVAAGRVTVVLHLLGPHGRPLQVTSDLASFWERTYAEIRREMRGRYPKHFWPEDPRRAPPALLARHGKEV
jgi:ATP-dependent helicase HrpB